MTPFELVAVIEDAVARHPRARRRESIVEFTAPSILGQQGKYLGEDATGPRFGYTKRQCIAMRQVVLQAAEDDRRAGG